MSSLREIKRNEFNKGLVVQRRFIDAAISLGFTTKDATKSEDINDHVDVWLWHTGKGPWGVDVKGGVSSKQIWVEFKNVAGNPGWMFGKAKIIAFEIPEICGFAIVDRIELLLYSLDQVENEFVVKRDDSYKKKYTRAGRNDVISFLNIYDIRSLESFRVWPYSTDF